MGIHDTRRHSPRHGISRNVTNNAAASTNKGAIADRKLGDNMTAYPKESLAPNRNASGDRGAGPDMRGLPNDAIMID